jgi:hypothetical protein
MIWEIGMQIEPTKYYDEFIRYYHMAKDQQGKTNLGWQDPATSTEDPLMNNVYLYDVVERGLAGFSQIIHDCFHGSSESHPYYEKMKHAPVWKERKTIISRWDNQRKKYGLVEWLYIFMVHRITGSAINYATIPSGYHNSILFDLHHGDTIEDMAEIIRSYEKPMFTSVGYQIAAFPKMPEDHDTKHHYQKPGKYWMCKILPDMIRGFTKFIEGKQSTFREMMSWFEKYSKEKGHRVYWFHYAAFLADIADWFPELVHRESMFFYGSNATECISYLAKKPRGMNQQDFLDSVMTQAEKDCNALAYNLEDVACDFIRWVENYVQPTAHYAHVDLDRVWSTSNIKDHPKGRQEAMLRLGLVESFHDYGKHPSDFWVLDQNNMPVEEYKKKVATINWSQSFEPKLKNSNVLLDEFMV